MTTPTSPPERYQRLTYRGDIDGLRAVAVVGVLVSHVAADVLPGGFLGVDVFFVISGYLIFGLLQKNHAAQTLSLATFYRRRVQRILPLAMVVLAVSLLVGWWSLYPHEFAAMGREAAAAAFMGANFFYFFDSGYFAPDAHLRPFLHFWSLGVEEQFYLVFPLLLVLCWRLRWPVRTLLFVLGALSFLLNLLLVLDHGAATFYLLPTRAWAFVLGAAVALWHAQPRTLTPIGATAGRTLGLLLIAGSFWRVQSWDPVPGVIALAPTMGAALVCFAHTPGRSARALDNVIARHIGRLSYGIYLWHWPLLFFLRVTDHSWTRPSGPEAGMVFGASYLLALCTQYCIEAPARAERGWLGRPIRVLALTLVVGGTGFAIGQSLVAPRQDGQTGREFAAAAKDWDPHGGLQMSAEGDVSVGRRPGKKPGTVLFVGDSNMDHFAPRIVEVMRTRPDDVMSAVFVTLNECRPVPQVAPRQRPACLTLWDVAEMILQREDVRRVVFSGSWDFDRASAQLELHRDGKREPLTDPVVRRRALTLLEHRMSRLRDAGRDVVLIQKVPDARALRDAVRAQRRWLPGTFRAAQWRTSLARAEAISPEIREDLRLTAKRAGALVIDPIDTMCGAADCFMTDETGAPIYMDAFHLRASFVRKYLSLLDKTILAAE